MSKHDRFEPALFESLVMNSRDMLYRMTLPDGRYEFVSPSAEEIFGYTPEEFYATPMMIKEIVHPDDLEYVGEQWQRLLAGTAAPIYEYRIHDSQGNLRWMHQRNTLILNEDGTPAAIEGIVSDITALKQAQEALRESEERYADALAAVGVGMWDLNVQTGIGIVSESWASILGYTRQEVMPVTMEKWYSLLHTEDRERFDKAFERHLSGETDAYECEVRLRHKQGHWVDILDRGRVVEWTSDGKPLRVTGTQEDITERKRQANELRDKEQKLRQVLEHSTNVHYAHTPDNILTYLSPQAHNLLGYEQEEDRIRWTDMATDHPINQKAFEATLRAMETGQRQPPYEVQLRHKDGHAVWGMVNESPVVENGRVVAMVGSLTDITELHRMEELVRQAEKMTAVGQLAGGIAHDFNNQLTGVLAYAELLRNRLTDERLQQFADNIILESKRAADLTAQLLAFSRKGKSRNVAVDMHQVLGEVTSILERTISKSIAIEQYLKASPCWTTGDPTQIQNALLNIALNARDAMPEGGTIVFATEALELDEEHHLIRSLGLKPGRALKLSVSDTGCGMDAETQKRMFEPFFTTKRVNHGTGLGLANVYGTIRNHNGAIDVDSAEGRGTTIIIYLPLTPSPAKSEDAGKGKIVAGTGRILLVDDEDHVRQATTMMLKDLGYDVVTCNDGREAVEYYRKASEEIDLVILDMIMPRLGGGETFAEMKKINPDIRVILASGYSMNGEAQSILNEGAGTFLDKPFQMAELSQKMAQALQQA